MSNQTETSEAVSSEKSGREFDDGGLAFPAIAVGPSGDVYHQVGMSLRDWFAGQALSGLIASGAQLPPHLTKLKSVGQIAFAYADAMIAARDTPHSIEPKSEERE